MKPRHGRLEFILPAPRERAFEAFFNHQVRLRWDTLLHVTYVEGGGTHPYAGAIRQAYPTAPSVSKNICWPGRA